MNYIISELAKRDLEDIYAYTIEKWSINQANRYYELIIEEIQSICRNPEIGKSLSEIKKHHRSRSIKSHLIIYKQENQMILIDRILHRRMDINKRLTS